MTDTEEQLRELAAKAAFEHEWRAPGEPGWDDLTPGDQESYRYLADAVLAAVTRPLYAEADRLDGTESEYNWAVAVGVRAAARMLYPLAENLPYPAAIARSLSTQPTEEETTNG